MHSMITFPTPIGRITVAETGGWITNVYIERDHSSHFNYPVKHTDLLNEAKYQLTEYFLGKRKAFNLPLLPTGTNFVLSVWQTLVAIPYGETRSYKEIAEAIDNPKACRAVGQANNKNPIPILIPCHRVVGANGHLVGYGAGLDIKAYLLRLEQQYS